ncbi:Solute carrier family 23 member 2 [Stylophora pistillata]|uniref:Solute carrier family 23 member 2 n=1 Tax=Stylophora pistillata TaxID=50429 RepID=A0A2B4SCE9_STYPI|nr:Solute carrier family 23 member 2 [Stylophora pistillata]
MPVGTEVAQTSKADAEEKKRAFGLTYLIDENPPWYICLLLGFQHYLTMLGGTLSIPFILSGPMCFGSNTLAISEVLSTILFVSGVVTLLQSTFGARLPIIQGGAFSFLTPTFAILSLPQWNCDKLKENSNSTIEMSDIWKPGMREVILAIAVSWIICAIITAAGGFPSDPDVPQYMARTDARTAVLKEAKWFRFPYPGQWGTPSVSAAGVFGMLAGVLASIIESVGDYYACARLAGAPPPPKHAVNRGIGMEGLGCLLAGAFGTGNGTTSYSENVGAIGITKVGSLRVIQFGALVLMAVGVLGKFGALFVCIPDPIVGGVFMVMFGMITAVGISNLQFADMNSSRNLFIVGFSTVFGLGLPYYMKNHDDAINTGVSEIDQIVTVLFKTSMAVGCISALILDNTIPGTDEERGIKAWREHLSDDSEGQMETASIKVYDLPLGLNRVTNFKVAKYLPFLPNHEEEHQAAYNVEMNSVH